jgi:hypothetical protein
LSFAICSNEARPSACSPSRRRLYIFNVTTVEEAQKLVALDPAVKAGVFVPDLTPWYGSAAMLVVNETHRKIEKPAGSQR